MKVSGIDLDKRLYQLIDLLPQHQVDEILSVDWCRLECQPGNLRFRNRVIQDQIEYIDRHITKLLPGINQWLGTTFGRMHGQWWVDHPGFYCPLHTDGELPNSLQMYWITPGENYGTEFYYYKEANSLKHRFRSIVNTGYIMLNHPNEDGSQPLQWHAMMNVVPRGHIRVSSYHILEL